MDLCSTPIITNTDTNTKLKVLMLPWLAHGHVSPYFELSKRLIDNNFFIYFCSTPVIINSIKNKINSEQSPSIEFVELHLEPSPELPPDRHTTKELPGHLQSKLKDALDMAAPSFALILESLKPDLVIYDIFQPWAADLSSSHGIPAVHFITGPASFFASMFHYMKHPEKEFPCRVLTPRYFINFPQRGEQNPPGDAPGEKKKSQPSLLETVKLSSEIVLVKSFEELEGEFFDHLSELVGKRVVAVGPLVESLPEGGDDSDEIMMWLEEKDESSTVLVSLGSDSFLTEEEVKEIALGLELAKVNFLWILRFPAWEKTRAEDVLPDGFLKKVGKRGMIWENWAPQMKILAHPSIGGFMSHCGWSSAMESMRMGVPIIGLPLQHDQPSNARLIEELGVGIEVWRDDGTMKGEEIAKTIQTVVVEKDGLGVREKAKSFGQIVKEQEEGVNMAAKELINLCKKK